MLRGSSLSKYTAEGYTLNNEASSAAANGNSCMRTRFYDGANSQYGNWQGPYFELYSQSSSSGYQNRDPMLSNGAGNFGSWRTENWNDRVTSVQFICT